MFTHFNHKKIYPLGKEPQGQISKEHDINIQIPRSSL